MGHDTEPRLPRGWVKPQRRLTLVELRVLIAQKQTELGILVRQVTTVLRTATLNYVYDFGDYWEHQIKVEKTLAPDPQFQLPFCIGGANATPPDDCGGVPGYEEFVRAMADPNDPEHDNLAEWLGADSWVPTAFDSIEVNERLAEIKL